MSKAILTVVLMSLLASPAQAFEFDKNRQEKKSQVIFEPEHQRIIRDYFRTNTNNLPPGLAKRNGNLPPGLQKHLQRNGQLPPGLQKRITGFPADLEIRLPRLPGTYRRGILGDRAIIYDPTTLFILDALELATGGRLR